MALQFAIEVKCVVAGDTLHGTLQSALSIYFLSEFGNIKALVN